MRVCTVAMALVVVHALQLPGSCRSSTSAAQRGAVGMALSDGVLNVGETARDVMHMRCTCDAHAMPCGVHAIPVRCPCAAHAGVIGAGRIGLVHLEALSSCETYAAEASNPGLADRVSNP